MATLESKPLDSKKMPHKDEPVPFALTSLRSFCKLFSGRINELAKRIVFFPLDRTWTAGIVRCQLLEAMPMDRMPYKTRSESIAICDEEKIGPTARHLVARQPAGE